MIHTLKDRCGLTRQVEQIRHKLKGQYDHYPRGIAKVRLDRSVRMRDWVNIYLDEPIDFDILREIADENGYDYKRDATWFGFYESKESDTGTMKKPLVGSFSNTDPIPLNVSILGHDSMDDFRLWVVVRYLQKKYGESTGSVSRSDDKE